MIKILSDSFAALRDTFLGIFVDGYDEEKEREIVVEEFNKYDCICESNIKGNMNVHGYCREHKTDWI